MGYIDRNRVEWRSQSYGAQDGKFTEGISNLLPQELQDQALIIEP
jgi:hypothetical protein